MGLIIRDFRPRFEFNPNRWELLTISTVPDNKWKRKRYFSRELAQW